MTQEEIKNEISNLLEQISILIDDDLKDVEPEFSDDEQISYIFFIRICELFKSILILISSDVDQVIPANILLRSLAEYYILLKSSIDAEDFNERHIKKAAQGKISWLKTTLGNHQKSGFQQDPQFFEAMKDEVHQTFSEYEKNMQQIYQLFRVHEELPLYLHVYAPASRYVHGDRHSFNIYHGPQNTVKRERANGTIFF